MTESECERFEEYMMDTDLSCQQSLDTSFFDSLIEHHPSQDCPFHGGEALEELVTSAVHSVMDGVIPHVQEANWLASTDDAPGYIQRILMNLESMDAGTAQHGLVRPAGT